MPVEHLRQIHEKIAALFQKKGITIEMEVTDDFCSKLITSEGGGRPVLMMPKADRIASIEQVKESVFECMGIGVLDLDMHFQRAEGPEKDDVLRDGFDNYRVFDDETVLPVDISPTSMILIRPIKDDAEKEELWEHLTAFNKTVSQEAYKYIRAIAIDETSRDVLESYMGQLKQLLKGPSARAGADTDDGTVEGAAAKRADDSASLSSASSDVAATAA